MNGSGDLPPSHAQHPPRTLLRLQPLARRLVSLRWDVRVHGADLLPESGPAILASNHIGLMDGPLLAILAPRPVHALTKREMFEGRAGRFLGAAGQIPLDRFAADPAAIKSCLRVLREGGVVGIYPEGTRGDGALHRFHHGAAYLALVTGAPVVPVTMFGTRPPGGHADHVPPRGARIDLVLGTPWRTEATAWPRRREHVRGTSALLLEHMRSELDRAVARTGRTLPGPLPAGESEDDPDTGIVDQGAS